MSLNGICKVPRVFSVPSTGHMSLTIFSDSKAGSIPHISKHVTRAGDRQLTGHSQPEITVQGSKKWLVRATDSVTVAPRCQKWLLGKLESEKGLTLPPLVCVEPAQIIAQLS
jgi:hypothetical protein